MVAVASGAWGAAHLFAMGALATLPISLHTAGLRRAAIPAGVGVALVLPYYGAETFGLQAVASQTLATGGTAMPALTDAIRFGPGQAMTFVAGLLVLAVAGVLAAVDARRRGDGWSGLALAAGLVLFLQQFCGTPAVRIGRGLLVLAGCLVLARSALRRGDPDPSPAGGRLSSAGDDGSELPAMPPVRP